MLLMTAVVGMASFGDVPAAMAEQLTAPTLVQASLQRFAHDDADMVRHAAAKAYERLPKEEDDFAKDAELLRAAIHDEPAAFRRKVEARIQEVLNASHDVSIAGQKPVDAVVRRALDELTEAVQKLNAEFPEALRSPV